MKPSSSVHQTSRPWTLTLSNGLRVWGETRPNSPTLAAHLVVGAGARHAPRGQSGLPHFVEHVLFSGSERWPERQLHSVVHRLSGECGGYTAFDYAGYWVRAPQENLTRALEWLAQLVFHPTFPEHKVTRERQAIARERALHDPQLLRLLRRLHVAEELADAIDERLFGATTERALGSEAEVGRLTRPDLVDFHWRHYVSSNAGLVLVGPLAQAEAADLAERCFGEVAARSLPPATPPVYPAGPHRLEVRGPVAQGEVTLVVGARTVGAAHPDRPALEVLAEILRERLLAELRFRRGLTYTPYAYNVFYRDSGYFASQVTVLERHAAWAYDTLRGEIDAVRAGGLRKREVRAAVRKLQSEAVADGESGCNRAEMLADLILDWPDGAALPDHLAAYGAVKPEDVAEALKRCDTRERRFEGRQVPLVELDRVKDVVCEAKRVAILSVGLGAAAFLWRRVGAGAD